MTGALCFPVRVFGLLALVSTAESSTVWLSEGRVGRGMARIGTSPSKPGIGAMTNKILDHGLHLTNKILDHGKNKTKEE
jgi:hypothetical protein